uniref:Ovule protein n=1 Tax=Steinernema glaseri TaxID=37863 RepID=A0A1I8AC46_9BILA
MPLYLQFLSQKIYADHTFAMHMFYVVELTSVASVNDSTNRFNWVCLRKCFFKWVVLLQGFSVEKIACESDYLLVEREELRLR